MKRITFIIISLMIFSFDIYCQDFNCAKYFEKYCKNLKSDSIRLPNYTAGYFYSGNNQDSTIVSIPNCINDLDAFCSGVRQALEADKLSIRQVGDPGHVSACSYASYENHGVYLTMTGDIIDNAGIFDENSGFNFIMKQRIQDSLGIEVLRNLGKKDSTWLEFNESQMKVLFEVMTIETKTDSTIFIKINELELRGTEFINLKGVVFTDALSKVNYSYEDMLKGVDMKSRGDRNKRAFLMMDFEGYSNPKFCKSRFNSRWTIPIKINE
ncbi:MAG TPA: hypothetical protein VL021_04485 [Brumimicrobium sp.]|nr:hypothetical protein [Brumimicrobium sp.]